MRFLLTLILSCSFIFSCTEESKSPFNINQEPLSTKAEVMASNWNGYNDFVFELKSLTENFSRTYAIEKAGNLVSKSQAILYSVPSELRNDIIQERTLELVESTKLLKVSNGTKSEEELKVDLKQIIDTFTSLNKEINYYTDNP